MSELKNFFIFIKSSSIDKEGQLIEGEEATLRFLNLKKWPLYDGTPNQKKLKINDQIVFYSSSTYKKPGQLIATAVVDEIINGNSKDYIKSEIFIDKTISVTVNLKCINIFKKTITLKDIKDYLEFTKVKNDKKWGATLIGGVRKITENDFIKIMSFAK
jgi:predicted RNA-binding protein with PUA-like domain